MTDPDSMHADTHSSDRVRSINTDVYINPLLASACYGMSTASATPDNACIMISRHFTEEEIVEAKVMLWSKCELGTMTKRNSTNKRSAKEAHVGYLFNAL